MTIHFKCFLNLKNIESFNIPINSISFIFDQNDSNILNSSISELHTCLKGSNGQLTHQNISSFFMLILTQMWCIWRSCRI